METEPGDMPKSRTGYESPAPALGENPQADTRPQCYFCGGRYPDDAHSPRCPESNHGSVILERENVKRLHEKLGGR